MLHEIKIRSARTNRDLLSPAAAAALQGIAMQESATAGTAELADGSKPIAGFLTRAVTVAGPIITDHIFTRLGLPTKAGEPASLEDAEEFEAEGDDFIDNVVTGTALKTRVTFAAGKVQIALTGDYAEFMLVEKDMTPEVTGNFRARFQRIAGHLVP